MSNFNKIKQSNFYQNNKENRRDEGVRFVNLNIELGGYPIELKVIFYKYNSRVEFDYKTGVNEPFYGRVVRNLSKSEYLSERFNFIDIYETRKILNRDVIVDIKNEIETKDSSKTPLILNEYFNFNKSTVKNKKDVFFKDIKISLNTNLIRFKAYKKETSDDYCVFYIERSRFSKEMNTDYFTKRTSAIEFIKT